LEKKKSLIFYYCNHGNPLDEKARRIIVGIGRLKETGLPQYFGTKKGYLDQYPIWSRRVTQDYPHQGVRIPYQEYLNAGHPTENIICRVPASCLLAFSYVGEHVSDDQAVAIIERVIQSIETVQADNKIPGDWENRLSWLNNILGESWSGRGPFPGIGSVLQYLGFSKGIAFQRSILAPMAKKGGNLWEYVLAILEGREEPAEGPYKKGLIKAKERWTIIKTRHKLLAKLARFELSPDQVRRIADPKERQISGIEATEKELVANPYIIAESDLGTIKSSAIALEIIDHGMRPQGDAALFPDEDEVSQDDRRRVRAVAKEVLNDAANDGDTVLPFQDVLNLIRNRFPDKRSCYPDPEVLLAEQDFYKQILWTAFDEEPQLVALKHLQFLEQDSASKIKQRARKTNKPPTNPIPWQASLEKLFGKPKTDREKSALQEKQIALETLFIHRLSILTGGAGTGKTSVLKVFLKELEKAEGRSPLLLLAPTGKARVRLATKTGRNAMTIHQFLLKQGWFIPDIFVLKKKNDELPFKATTVVIDECSMIPTDLFGTLLRALDMGPLTRLILVGDPNQLPPIGPGRPFVDIIKWLEEKAPECIAPLLNCMRIDEEEDKPAEESRALALAEGYRETGISPGDDEILSEVAKGKSEGDLEIAFWDGHDDLIAKLKERMETQLLIRENDYKNFNKSLGIDSEDWDKSEAWQILSPTRTQYFGTDMLNQNIQMEYRGGLIATAKNPWNKIPQPFGDQEIVFTDKVIQIHNRSIKGWPRDTGLDYVANGEIGIVSSTTKSDKGDYLDVFFSTQIEVSYRYYRGQINENLELAYALTVHKAQGSDFEIVFLIIPQDASTLSRELIYTGLTRFRKKLVILIEKDIQPLIRLRSPDSSETRQRITQMFRLPIRPEDVSRPYLEALIHRTKNGTAVRSKSEVIVADILESLGISYEYEKPLFSESDTKDFRLPDFTASYQGDVYHWEHLGMLSIPSYREAWERKLEWYKLNGYSDTLITSEDNPDGGIDAAKIERIAHERILEFTE